MTPRKLPADYTCIGVDLATTPGTAVLGELRDGRWTFTELDLDKPETFAGLQVDAVWVEEMDLLP